MPRIIGWRVWYADLQVFSSADVDWEELPKDGVLGVVAYEDGHDPNTDEVYRLVHTGQDYYFKALSEQGKLIIGSCCGSSPLEIYQRYGPAESGTCVKRGKWTDNETYEAVAADIHAAKEAP